MDQNRCLALLLCDGASRSKNGKIDLHGIFDLIQVVEDVSRPQPAVGVERPAPLAEKTPLFFVFYKLEVAHPSIVQLTVRDPKGNSVNGGWSDEIAEAGLIQTVWALNVGDFTADGLYTLQLVCDQQTLSETRLDVLHVVGGQPNSG